MKPKEDGRPKTMLYKFPGTMLKHGVKAGGEINMADFDYIVVDNSMIDQTIADGWSLTPYQAVYKESQEEEPEEETQHNEPSPLPEKYFDDKLEEEKAFDLGAVISEINKIRGRNATDRLSEYAETHGITLDDTNKYLQMKAELIDALRIKHGLD